MKTRSLLLVSLVAVGGLAGCATTDDRFENRQDTSGRSDSRSGNSNFVAYGVVESITQSRGGVANSGVGAGTIIGGVVGGVVGSQIGGGSGKTVATVAGVAGGALIGREIDKNRQTSNPHYTVRVRLNNGDYQTMNLDGIGELRTGDRVRIENNQLYRY